MTDLVQKLVGALEMVDRAVYIDDSGKACLNASFNDEQLQAALSEAKAGGWVAVPERTTGDAFENAIRRYGVAAACEWFGHAHDSEFTKETQRVLDERLQPLPAPPAQRGEG